MPIKIPDAAGELYRPSNGTEGMKFMEQFCDRCRFGEVDEKTGEGCDIQLRSLVHNTDEPGYPAEWRFDFAGRPDCTAFVEGE